MPDVAVNPGSVEQTGAQVSTTIGQGDILFKQLDATYKTYREMRKDPTIAMTRALQIGTLAVGDWSVEADDEVEDDRIKLVRDCVLRWRSLIIRSAMAGTTDFGWAPFEVVWGIVNDLIQIVKVKPLLHDITTVLVVPQTGAFRGYRQRDQMGQNLDLLDMSTLHVAFRVEGTQWYGQALLENARGPYNKWIAADAGAARYDAKIAGSHFVCYHPIGKTLFNGVLTDNAEIAKALLNTLESSGSIAVPDQFDGLPKGEDDRPHWKIEILEDKGARQPGFVDRLKYLDAQKVRALLVPERAITEGTFGTKAEAEAHGSIAVTNLEVADLDIADAVNEQLVDRLLMLNFGPEAVGTIRIEPSPLIDEAKTRLAVLYNAIITNPNGFIEEFQNLDTDAIKDQLGIPKRTEVAAAGDDILDIPEDGMSPEQLALMAGFTPRTEGGRWTYDATGLVPLYGTELSVADDCFRQARQLANAGKFDDARKIMYSIQRPKNAKAHFAVQRRMSQMLERFLRMESRRIKAVSNG